VGAPFFTTVPTLVSLPAGSWFDRELSSLVEEIQSASAERPYTLALKTITLIAADLGFNSPAYFARFFHSSTGQSPIFFRQTRQKTK